MLRTVKSPQVSPRLIAGKITTANSGNIRTVTADIGGGDVLAAPSLQDGNPSMLFDGSNDRLATNYNVNPTGGLSVFAVVRFNVVAATTNTILSNADGAGTRVLLQTASNTQLFFGLYNGASNSIGRRTADLLNTSNLFVFVATYDGGTAASGIKIFVNGVASDTTDVITGSYTLPTAGNALTIGANNPGTSPLNGLQSEFGLFSKELTATEVAQISSQLMNKYGIVGAPLGPDYTLDIGTIADLEVWGNAGNVTTASGAVSAMTDLSGNSVTISQGTPANRPLITRSDAGENRFLHSEDYSNAAWTKSNLVANPAKVGTFGDTGNPYFTMTANTTNGTHVVQQAITLVSGQKYIVGFRYKSAGSARPQLRLQVGAVMFSQRFDFAGNTVNVAGAAQVNQVLITPLANGFYEVQIAFTSNASASTAISLRINQADGTDSFVGTADDTIEFGEFFIAVGTGGKKYTPTTTLVALPSPEQREYAALPLSQGFVNRPVQFVQGVDGGTEFLYQVRSKPELSELSPIDIVTSAGVQSNATANILAVGFDGLNTRTSSLLQEVKSTAADAVMLHGEVAASTPAFSGTTGLTMVRQSTGVFNFTFTRPGMRACIAFAAATAGTARRNLYVKNEANTGFTVETRNESGNLANINFNVVVLAYYNKFDQAKMRRALKNDQREPRLLACEFTGGDGTTAVVGESTDFTVARGGVGDYDITFVKPFKRIPTILPCGYNGLITAHVETKSASGATLRFFQAGANVAIEPSNFGVIVIGSDDVNTY